jgi:hypothetical protein
MVMAGMIRRVSIASCRASSIFPDKAYAEIKTKFDAPGLCAYDLRAQFNPSAYSPWLK